MSTEDHLMTYKTHKLLLLFFLQNINVLVLNVYFVVQLDCVNSIRTSIQLTMDEECNNPLELLDVVITHKRMGSRHLYIGSQWTIAQLQLPP